MIAKGLIQLREMNREVEETMDEHGQAMVRILEEADQLRLSTVKELVNILTPLQAVDFLVAIAVAEDDGWMEGGIRYLGFIREFSWYC
ncbi:hypothetical protein L3X38_035944 [Prunus dulcis]|uniref:DOG1 domain-containing protein n=1 Tax=Prunus dulcis TaxID=3755 RepID=A0AAD4VKM0_PRUDU|nr:hypothetical protein L3X38_035944 [Prunus dulcis]